MTRDYGAPPGTYLVDTTRWWEDPKPKPDSFLGKLYEVVPAILDDYADKLCGRPFDDVAPEARARISREVFDFITGRLLARITELGGELDGETDEDEES